jgi:hypothetical protein
MKKPILIFEPITGNQIWKIREAARSQNMTDEKKMEMVAGLIGIPDITALSKQEASFIIDRIQGTATSDRPYPPKMINQMNDEASTLPTSGQIYLIRHTVKDLGWSIERFKTWLFDHTGRPSICDISRADAKKLCYLAIELLKQRN